MTRPAQLLLTSLPHISLFNFMKKPYNLRAGFAQQLRQLGLTAALLGGSATVALAQNLSYPVAQASNSAGTYTDLGITGTVIATANNDNANSVAQNIGFSFSYGGATFTQFVFNTNGVVRLGNAAPSTAALYYDSGQTGTGTDPLQSTDAADTNLIMPFNIDLVPGSGAGAVEYRVATTGTAPNRVCTIQWKNVADKQGAGQEAGIGTQYANFSFQVKLYETTNAVDFVYGAATAGTAGAVGTRYPQIGLKAGGLSTSQLLLALKRDISIWKTTTFTTDNYASQVHDIIRTVLPDAGRTYHFGPAVANDVAIRGVYTLNKVATLGALPQGIRVYIANLGTTAQTNLPITLTVTGANSFTATNTLASLPAGAAGYLTFATSLPNTFVAGTNTVTVSVPADDNSYNNAANVEQLISTNTMSYLEPSRALDGITLNYGAANGILATKFTLGAVSYLGSATLQFATGNGPTTDYQVVVYNANGTGGVPGTLLYTSPTQSRPAAGASVTVPISPLQLPVGSFYIGIKEIGTTGASLATQTEVPLRSTTFYISGNGTTWTDLANTTYAVRFGIEANLTVAPNCLAPTGLAVSGTTANATTVAFTAAASTSGYELVYGPSGFVPTAGTGTTVAVTTSPYTLTGLQPATKYDVYIRSVCATTGTSTYAGPVSFTTGCAATTSIAAFPYTESFDKSIPGQSLPCGYAVLDANADGTTWRISTENPNSGTNNMRYQGSVVNNTVANDWFFTPALVLPGTANTRYQVAFRYRAAGVGSTGTSNFTESLEVKSGTAATAAGQTNLLYTNTSINNLAYVQAGGSSTPVVAYLPAGASTQYLGFHAISAANQGNLYIDDLSVTAVVVTSTSEALLRAVSVFPNPSATGVFNLAVSGANAQKGLELEVVNTLGQRVYAGTARDNFTTTLDLSNLANGLYHLKVRNGNDYLVRQISIVK
jgi:hypothetical protein